MESNTQRLLDAFAVQNGMLTVYPIQGSTTTRKFGQAGKSHGGLVERGLGATESSFRGG